MPLRPEVVALARRVAMAERAWPSVRSSVPLSRCWTEGAGSPDQQWLDRQGIWRTRVLLIEERIAPDRDLGIGLGDLAELHPDVAFAHIRAHGFREHANADLELRRHLIKHRLHDRGHARHHDYIADPEARRS
jgi:hypothetical protein